MSNKNLDWANLGFGYVQTDKRYVANFKNGAWEEGFLTEDATVTLNECAGVFQYAQTVFEGLKAYRTADGRIVTFRPDLNAQRMADSARRLEMPVYPEDKFIEAVEAVVAANADFVPPYGSGATMYLRPYMFGNDESLGVHTVHRATYMIIASPSGSYYKEGINPVKIMIESEDVRTVRGGTGYAKCGGNYAASNRAGERANKKGYSQVLWLDGVERKYIEEVGAMNVMFRIGDEIITPELTGSILPGITRKSCIEVLKKLGYKVTERLFSIDELKEALKNGTLKEAWGCGTAAVVSPIGKLMYEDVEYEVGGGKIGEVTQKLYDILTGIQWGSREDEFGWIYKLS